jgi:hypothetical protein
MFDVLLGLEEPRMVLNIAETTKYLRGVRTNKISTEED